jgi:hypothetical protein
MFDNFKAKLKRAYIENCANKINSLAGDLSVSGYPDEAAEIRMALDKIQRQEKNNAIKVSTPISDDSLTVFRYVAMSSRGAEVNGEVRAKDQGEAIIQIRKMGYFPTRVIGR